MHRHDLASNNPLWLIRHKSQTTQPNPTMLYLNWHIYIYIYSLVYSYHNAYTYINTLSQYGYTLTPIYSPLNICTKGQKWGT